MLESSEKEIARLIDESKIRRALFEYCRAVDRCDWPLLRSLYHEDAVDLHGAYEGPVEGFIRFAMETMNWMEAGSHHLTNIIIDIDEHLAWTESNFISMSAGGTDESGGLIDLILMGRYLDRFERRNGIWKIVKRRVVFDTNHTMPASSRWDGPFYGGFIPRGRKDRSDPVYSRL